MSKKYPTGLIYLFFTEMWERFSFYGISAIIVLYMTKELHMADDAAYLAFGAYTAFSFMTPILGGFVADKVLGLRRSVFVGGILILVGNGVLALGGGLSPLFVGLSCVALGTGFLKSTVSVMVGNLYKEGDAYRDSGYTLFYMGINVGALLATLLVGAVFEAQKGTKGFYLSAAGMLLGLITFFLGRKHYNNDADGFKPEKVWKRSLVLPNLVWIVVGTLALGSTMYYLFGHPGQTKQVISYLGLAIVGGIIALALSCKEKRERNAVLGILVIILAAVCYHALIGKQIYGSVNLLVERDFNRSIFGRELPASYFGQGANSLVVILLAGVLAWVWAKLADKGKNPSIPAKIVLALCLAVTSAFMLAWLARGVGLSGVKSSALWVAAAITILTLGELNILPMGLSAASALAPKRYASMLMGSWFLTSSLGGYFAGYLSSLASVDKARVNDLAYTGMTYYGLYWKCAAGLAIVTIIMFVTKPVMKKLMLSNPVEP
jgi:POT family proton-dependent oligopeptide transporter